MNGSDDFKYNFLKKAALEDFETASIFKVSERFVLAVAEKGEENEYLHGYANIRHVEEMNISGDISIFEQAFVESVLREIHFM